MKNRHRRKRRRREEKEKAKKAQESLHVFRQGGVRSVCVCVWYPTVRLGVRDYEERRLSGTDLPVHPCCTH